MLGLACDVVKSVATPTFRFMTCSCILDYNTVAAADKFGNIAVVGGHYLQNALCHTDVQTPSLPDTPPTGCDR